MENATVGTTLNEDTYHSFLNFENIVFLVTVLISLCGLAVNGIVIWLLGFVIKRNPFSVYILNLASADFIFLLCAIVFFIIFILKLQISILVSLVVGLTITSWLVDLSLVTAISFERCLSVLFPIWYRCRRPTYLSTVFCFLIWGLSFCSGMMECLCEQLEALPCVLMYFVCYVLFPFALLVICVSSLILLIRVHCCSWRRQSNKLHLIVFLTVLIFLTCGFPLGVGIITCTISEVVPNCPIVLHICRLLSIVNSSVNPFIYFFVGRHRQKRVWKSLREVLQSALEDDSEPTSGVETQSSCTT
ncbi:mas-related G-protein coupled receptor member X4-like [Choloepus didactylus]|uniref:mas-related G-protein coupled receptor member X4-like n=1 Tax=Choloepus didactylus TaxID=27675 RepID=UPI0018A075E4|nr:mas-related G-protein coupled receptor member X4-like [Choloepus didactylus]